MVRIRLSALALPVVLLASACTITTYDNAPPPPRPPPKGRPAPAASAQPQPAAGQGGGMFRPGMNRAGAAGAAGAGDTTPKVTSATPFGGGTPAAFRGLAYVVPPDTKKMPDVSTLVPFAVVYTDSFNTASQDFTAGFPGALAGQVEFFAIRYDGKFSLPNDGTWQFKLNSDDGAILSIDGAKIIDNDGVHTATSAVGQTTLKAGTHTLRLDYFQAKGPVALQLYMIVGGQERILIGTK